MRGCRISGGRAAVCRCVQVLQHSFDANLGGRDFDLALYKVYAAKIQEKYRMDVNENKKARYVCHRSCNNCCGWFRLLKKIPRHLQMRHVFWQGEKEGFLLPTGAQRGEGCGCAEG